MAGGVIGFCSGGRHAYLAACTFTNIDAAVDCGRRRGRERPAHLNSRQPVAPIALTESLACPLLGSSATTTRTLSRADVDRTKTNFRAWASLLNFAGTAEQAIPS